MPLYKSNSSLLWDLYKNNVQSLLEGVAEFWYRRAVKVEIVLAEKRNRE